MLSNEFWDKYQNQRITPQIKYWADYWEEKVQEFPDSIVGLRLSSPRLLLMDLLDEVEFNGLKNNKLKTHLLETLKEWLKKSNILPRQTISTLELVLSALNSETAAYVAEICRQGIRNLDEGKYFKHLVQNLELLLLKDFLDEKEYEYIEGISQLIIIEFMMNGFSLKTCAEFPYAIFDHYHFTGGILFSKFPTKIDSKKYLVGGQIDLVAHSKALALEIDSLTVSDRIRSLIYLFETSPRTLDFIFPLNNIKGNNELQIGDVKIYSPKFKRYSKNPSKEKYEFFHRESRFIYSNAIVELQSKDLTYSIQKAIASVDSALNILSFFSSSDTKPTIDRSNYLILDKNGEMTSLGSKTKVDEVPHWAWEKANDTSDILNLKSWEGFQSSADLIGKKENKLTPAMRQVTAALHWHKKAKLETHPEQKLVDYWIALEKMFSDAETKFGQDKFSAILGTLPYVYVKKVVFNIGWRVFYSLRDGVANQLLEIPESILKKSKLSASEGQTIQLSEFVSQLDEIRKYSNRRMFTKKITLAQKLFTEPKYAAKYLESMIKEVDTDLLLIYRYRNKIVHDAHYNDDLLPYHIEKIESYAGYFIGQILSKITEDTGSNYEMALAEKANLSYLIKQLKSGESNLINILS